MTNHHVFQIVVVGEDLPAVMRAQKLTRRLAAELEPELEISNDAWQFEALDKLPVLKEAAKGAATADMIIIAANGASELPARVKTWIESWRPRKRKGMTALVALCDHEVATPDASSPLCAYLRRIAGEWGMDFLTNKRNNKQAIKRKEKHESPTWRNSPRCVCPCAGTGYDESVGLGKGYDCV